MFDNFGLGATMADANKSTPVAPVGPVAYKPNLAQISQSISKGTTKVVEPVKKATSSPIGGIGQPTIPLQYQQASQQIAGINTATVAPDQYKKNIEKTYKESAVKAKTELEDRQTKSVKDLTADIQENGAMTNEDIAQYFPEFKGKEKAVADLQADITENGPISIEEIRQYYPELMEGPAKEVPKTFLDNVKDVGEGMVNFAGGLPKVISETGILDKPLQALSESRVGQAIRSGAEKLVGKEELQKYQQEQGGKTFSEFSKGSQVGGDPESKLAKRTENIMDVASLLSGVPALVKGVSKQVTKRSIGKVLNVIGEKGTQKQVAEAIADNRIKAGKKGLSKLLFGSKPEIIQKKQLQEAAKTIVTEIKGAKIKNPEKLYTQIDDFIETRAKGLSNDLKDLKIGTFTKDKAKTSNLLFDYVRSAQKSPVTPKEIKNIKEAILAIKKSKTADDLRQARKQLDLATPESVKKASSISSDVLQYRNAIWKQARGEINDLIEKSASKYGKGGVKELFKKFSGLYQAQDNIISKGTDIMKGTEGLFSKGNIKKAVIGGGALRLGNKLVPKESYQSSSE